MTEIWLATTNRGKVAEFEALLVDYYKTKNSESPTLKNRLHNISELDTYFPPEENGKTFIDNARIKARSLKAMRPGVWVLADDSGLIVEGLNGNPGVMSARYAGPKATDAENRAKVLKLLAIKQVANRNAAFECALVVFDPQGQEHIFTAKLNGKIGKTEAGKMGFGYDSVFIPDGETKTLAELGPAYKNTHSHRAKSVQEFLLSCGEKLL